MELSGDTEIIHQPTRLQIMRVLYRHRDVSYTRIRDLLELTDGNLASHANRLEQAGFIENRRAWSSNGFETRYRITKNGVKVFRSYLQELRTFVDGIDDS